jgi:hypothetical protein
MLANPDALEDVVLGANGLANALGAGQVYIDMSTVGPDTVRRSPPNCPKESPSSMRPSGAASVPPVRVVSRSSSAPAKKSSSGCGRSLNRSVL